MRVTEMFRNHELVHAIAVMKWAAERGYTIESIQAEMDEERDKKIDSEKVMREELREEVLKNKVLREKLALCPNDSFVLNVRESQDEDAESEVYCPNPDCGYIEKLDISPLDWNMMMSAKVQGKEPEFKPSETKASKEDISNRRAICKACDQLENTTCLACGCSMKHRTYYEILSCPKEKW